MVLKVREGMPYGGAAVATLAEKCFASVRCRRDAVPVDMPLESETGFRECLPDQ